MFIFWASLNAQKPCQHAQFSLLHLSLPWHKQHLLYFFPYSFPVDLGPSSPNSGRVTLSLCTIYVCASNIFFDSLGMTNCHFVSAISVWIWGQLLFADSFLGEMSCIFHVVSIERLMSGAALYLCVLCVLGSHEQQMVSNFADGMSSFYPALPSVVLCSVSNTQRSCHRRCFTM